MKLFKKDKIILNTPPYYYTNYTYYYADNKIEDKLIVRCDKDDKEELLRLIKGAKEVLKTYNPYSDGSPIFSLLQYLRKSDIRFDKADYKEILQELNSMLPYKINHVLEIVECLALYEGFVFDKTRR